MDRDKRWERVKLAVDGLTKPTGVDGAVSVQDATSAINAVESEYKKDITDEFLKPIIVGGDESRIKGACFPVFMATEENLTSAS